jgi:hypothetical protein
MELQEGVERLLSEFVMGREVGRVDPSLGGGGVFEANAFGEDAGEGDLAEIGVEAGAVGGEAVDEGGVGLVATGEEVAEFVGGFEELGEEVAEAGEVVALGVERGGWREDEAAGSVKFDVGGEALGWDGGNGFQVRQ